MTGPQLEPGPAPLEPEPGTLDAAADVARRAYWCDQRPRVQCLPWALLHFTQRAHWRAVARALCPELAPGDELPAELPESVRRRLG